MKVIIIASILLSQLHLFSQSENYIYRGEEKFKSTETWYFQCFSYPFSDPNITVAKHDNGGYLMITLGTPLGHFIEGIALVFLSDGTIIKCYDRKIRDRLDEMAMILYSFTQEEMSLLKNHRIMKIRFSLNRGSFGKESFTAENVKKYQSYGWNRDKADDNKDYYETDKEIQTLYE